MFARRGYHDNCETQYFLAQYSASRRATYRAPPPALTNNKRNVSPLPLVGRFRRLTRRSYGRFRGFRSSAGAAAAGVALHRLLSRSRSDSQIPLPEHRVQQQTFHLFFLLIFLLKHVAKIKLKTIWLLPFEACKDFLVSLKIKLGRLKLDPNSTCNTGNRPYIEKARYV